MYVRFGTGRLHSELVQPGEGQVQGHGVQVLPGLRADEDTHHLPQPQTKVLKLFVDFWT